jgi:hypothetical protein
MCCCPLGYTKIISWYYSNIILVQFALLNYIVVNDNNIIVYYNLRILFTGPIHLILWSSGRPPPTLTVFEEFFGLKLASPRKNSSKTGEFSGFFRNFCFGVFVANFFWSQSGEFSAKNKEHTAMNAVSQLGTQVSKVYR